MSKESRKNRNIRFVVYMTDAFVNTSLESLELSERSFNGLRRAGFRTIGDVLEKIERQDDLLRIRSLGEKSAKEIMHKIFRYHYEHLSKSEVASYQEKMAKLNGKEAFMECFLKS